MFKDVDKDGNGEISREEWLEFWKSVIDKGNSEEDVLDELEFIQNGEAWAKFN